MGKSKKEFKNPDLIEKLTFLITEKMGQEDKIDIVAHKVMDDYLAAKKIIKKYAHVHPKSKDEKMYEMEDKEIRATILSTAPMKVEKR